MTALADDDGVFAISGRAADDGATRGAWTVALDPKGDLLLLGSPNSLPRSAAVRGANDYFRQ